MTSTYGLKNVPAPLRLLIRPILFAALGLHALFLFMPLPAEQKLPQPDDKKNPIQITQVPTTKPQATTVATTRKPTPPKLTPAPARPAPLAFSRSTSAPLIPKPPETSFPSIQPGLLPSTPPVQNRSPEPQTPTRQLAAVDPAQALYQLIAEIPAPDKFDPAFTNLARLEHFEDPALFFKPTENPDELPEGLPGLDSSPKIAVGEEPDFFYQTFFEQPLGNVFEEVSKVGEYAGGPLYRLKRGTYTVYLNLIPAKGKVATIVSVWSRDPRSN